VSFFQEIYEVYKDSWFPPPPPTPIQQFLDMYQNHYVVAKQPKNILKCTVKLAEETGEVAEAVSAFIGNEKKTKKLAADNNTPEEGLSEELADVIIVALNIAHASKIDIDQMFLTAAAKMKRRTDKRISDKQLADAIKEQAEREAEKHRGIPPTAQWSDSHDEPINNV